VGISPMVAFARHLVSEGFRRRRMRPLHLIQLARSEDLRDFGAELRALAQRAKRSTRLHVVLDDSAGAPEGAIRGPLTIDLLKALLPFDDHEFFLCGPPGFMQALYDGLRDLGVRDARIQAEAFGPSSLKRRPDGEAVLLPPLPPPAQQATVSFTLSGDAAEWAPERGTLLEFAEGKGLNPPFSCRAGHCGSCATRITAGRVTYAEPTAWRPAQKAPVALAIQGQRLAEQRVLRAERGLQAGRRDADGRRQLSRRRAFVAMAPEQVHRGVQGLFPVKGPGQQLLDRRRAWTARAVRRAPAAAPQQLPRALSSMPDRPAACPPPDR
jgi:ferredoxin